MFVRQIVAMNGIWNVNGERQNKIETGINYTAKRCFSNQEEVRLFCCCCSHESIVVDGLLRL